MRWFGAGLLLVMVGLLAGMPGGTLAYAPAVPQAAAAAGSPGAAGLLFAPTSTPAPPTSTPAIGIIGRTVSSAYSTDGVTYDDRFVLDGDLNTAWISDPAQPPQGQWITLDVPVGKRVVALELTNSPSAMRYSRPLTTTISFPDNTSLQTLVWKDTIQTQRLDLPNPHDGALRLTVATVWGGAANTQPVGIAELRPIFAEETPTAAVLLPTTPPISGPTTTAPTTVPLAPATPLTSVIATNGPVPTDAATPDNNWRWVLVGLLVGGGLAFFLRGWRRRG